jgi:hypothetical protein
MNDALIRPIVGIPDQPCSHRIFANIGPLFGVTLLISQAMMKTARLKPRRGAPKLAPKFTFPKCDPGIDHTMFGCRRTEEMDVVRHDHVRANHPSICLAPRLSQAFMNRRISQSSFPSPRTDRGKDDGCSVKKYEHSLRWMAALR